MKTSPVYSLYHACRDLTLHLRHLHLCLNYKAVLSPFQNHLCHTLTRHARQDTLGAIGNNACQKSKVKCLKKDKRKELCQCMFAAECNLIYHFYV